MQAPMIEFAQAHSGEIVAIAAVILAYALHRLGRLRAKLVFGVQRAFTFSVGAPLLGTASRAFPCEKIDTVSVSVANLGSELARNVEIMLNGEPQLVNIRPARRYTMSSPIQGHVAIVLDGLAAKEAVVLELLAIDADVPEVVLVRSDSGAGIRVPSTLRLVQPFWKLVMARLLVRAGFAAGANRGLSR